MTTNKLLSGAITLAMTTSAYASAPAPQDKNDAIAVVVLGGGMGGLTAALYSARAGHETLVVEGEMPGGLLTQSHSVQNWPGKLNSSGEDIAVDIKAQCIAQGVTFASAKVVDADFSSYPFTIKTQALDNPNRTGELKALGAIIAMGTSSNYLGIAGEQENWGKGVSNCAVCDGGLYRDQTVCVVGGGDAAIEEASYLSRIAKKVFVLVRREKLRAVDSLKDTVVTRPNVEVLYNHEIAEINGDGEAVTSVSLMNNRTRSNRELPVDGVFLAIGSTPNGNIFNGKLNLDDKGYIVVDRSQATSVPGVYAIGDIADPVYKQAISAAGDGCKAALELNKFLESVEAQPKPAPQEPVVQVLAKEIPVPVETSSVASKKPAQEATRGVVFVTSDQQFDAAIEGDGVVVADFFATWCGPCKQMKPRFKQVADHFGDKATFLMIDIDKNKGLSNRFKVKSIPTLIYFKDGKRVDTTRGALTVDALTGKVNKLLK